MEQSVNPRKLVRMAVLAFENGLRLHRDAIFLFGNCSYPTAHLVSILSMEELGKSLALEDYLWHSAIDGKAPSKIEHKFLEALYNHKYKQVRFAANVDMPGHCRNAIQKIFDGDTEVEKQAATYVGLHRKYGKIDLKGKIENPIKVSPKKVSDQITIVNDFLVVLALGCIKGTHSMDLVGLEALFTHDLVNEFRKKWPEMSRSAKQRYLEIMKYDDIDIEDRGLSKN